MPIVFDNYKEQINAFNDKYGTDFSFEEYEKNQLRTHHLQTYFLGADKDHATTENNIYKDAFTNLFKKFAGKVFYEDGVNVNDEESKQPTFYEMVKDFEELMDVYRQYCEENKRSSPAKLGGWKSSEEINGYMYSMISELPTNSEGNIDKAEYAKNEYLEGRLSLRKMRADLEKMKDAPSAKDVARAIVYLRAIDKVRKERSFLSKLNPLNWPRMYAESRDYVALNNFTVEYAKANENNSQVYDDVINSVDSTAEPYSLKEYVRESENKLEIFAEDKASEQKILDNERYERELSEKLKKLESENKEEYETDPERENLNLKINDIENDVTTNGSSKIEEVSKQSITKSK